MNKVVHANVGGYALVINEDAFQRLEKYLEQVQAYFRHLQGYEEIVQDIETRMAELLREHMAGRQVVNLTDVEYAISIMGLPEEFKAEGDTSTADEHAKNESFRTGKKLYRDVNNKVVGGVCSGLAAFLGIKNANWVRLAFLIACSWGGVGLLVYLVLMVITPIAETPADYLSMKGKPINLQNIIESVEDQVKKVTDSVGDFDKHWDKTTHKFSSSFQQKSKQWEKNMQHWEMPDLTPAANWIQGFVTRVVKVLGGMVLGFGILFLLGVWITSIIGLSWSSPILNQVLPQAVSTTTVGFSVLSAIGLFLVFLILALLRVTTRLRIHPIIFASVGIAWMFSMGSLAYIGAKTGQEFSVRSSIEELQPINLKAGDTLFIAPPAENFDLQGPSLGPIHMDGKKIYNTSLKLDVVAGTKNELRITKMANGASRDEALAHASEIVAIPEWEQNRVVLPVGFHTDKGQKWRSPYIQYDIALVPGTLVKFEKAPWEFWRDCWIRIAEDSHQYDLGEYTWKVTEEGLSCSDCPPVEDITENF